MIETHPFWDAGTMTTERPVELDIISIASSSLNIT